MSENWKPIPGYVGRYEVSDLGRVRSLKGTPKILKPGLRRGYPSVVLAVNTVKKNRSVHTLVMEAFDQWPREGLEIAHLDGDRTNNHISNLKYVTHAENQRQMAQDHGMSLRGTKHHKNILTEDQVRAIRNAPKEYRGNKALAQKYGVSVSTIHAIRCRRIWAWLK